MVALTPRFALLAVLASLAAFSLAPADAAAVTARGKSSHADSDSYSSASAHDASVTSSSNLESNPVIPLPSRLASQATSSAEDFDSQSSKKKSKTDKKHQSKHKESEKVCWFFASRCKLSDIYCSDLPGVLLSPSVLKLKTTCLLYFLVLFIIDQSRSSTSKARMIMSDLAVRLNHTITIITTIKVIMSMKKLS